MIQHLACVMDGNRRWATQRGLPTLLGHKEGVKAVRAAVQFCIKNGIPHLTLYTFSLENFKRTEEEKSYMFGLVGEVANSVSDELVKEGVRICFVGDRALFPASVRDICTGVERKTASGSKLRVNLLFCYGGRQEILSSVRTLAHQVAAGTLAPDEITEDLLRNHMWMAGVPDPDLIIRTGAVMRTSNFLMFESAYSEYIFLDCMWPDMTEERFAQALVEFNQRQRRFGA